MSIAHQLLMAVGVKIATIFVFLTHDIASFFVFFVSSFGEYSVTYRWAVGTETIFAQFAARPATGGHHLMAGILHRAVSEEPALERLAATS